MSCKYKGGNTAETQSEDGMGLLKLKKICFQLKM